MNILLSANSKFFRPLCTLIYSLYKTQTEKLNLYFIKGNITEEEIVSLKDLCRQLHIEIHILSFYNTVEKELNKIRTTFSSILEEKRLSVETYYRLFIIPFLPLERILWLDADCLVQKDLKDFYYQNFENRYLVACDHCDIDWTEDLEFSIVDSSRKRQHYFNAGVLLLNLELLRYHDFYRKDAQPLLSKFILNFNTEPLLSEFDQSILNVTLRTNVKWTDPLKYNCPQNWFFYFGQRKDHPKVYEILENAYILHYCGNPKPWDIDYQDKRKKEYYLKVEEELNSFLKEK